MDFDNLWTDCPKCRTRFLGNLCPKCGWDEAKEESTWRTPTEDMEGAFEDTFETEKDAKGWVTISIPLDFLYLDTNNGGVAEKLEEVVIVARNAINEAIQRWKLDE